MLVGVGGAFLLAGDVGPFGRVSGIELEPFLEPAFGVGKDRLGRALGLADAAVDALSWCEVYLDLVRSLQQSPPAAMINEVERMAAKLRRS